MQEVEAETYSPLALAYIGDCIFDLVIKNLVLNRGNKQVKKLHKETSQIVQASSQSKMMRVLQDELTEDEHRSISADVIPRRSVRQKISL